MRKQVHIFAIAFAVGSAAGLAPLAAGASESIEGTLTAIVIDYPAEDGDATAHDHDGAAAQSGEMPELGRAEYVYRLQRDDGTEVRLQGEEALAPYTTGDRLSVQGRMVSAAGSDGPNRMAVRSVEPLADADGDVARQETAADHGEDGITQRRVLGIVLSFNGSATAITLDDARNAIRASSTSSDALFRIGSGGDADSGGQMGFFPPEGNGPDVIHVDMDTKADGCDYSGWADAADEAARNKGVDFSNHQHTVYFMNFHATTDCGGWAGLGYVGCGGGSCRAWVRYQWALDSTTAHELGHNVGLNHTRAGSEEYGEWSLMGKNYGYIVPPQREFLGWYDDQPGAMQIVEGGEETVTIAGLSADYHDSQPHTVKLPVADGERAYYAYLADEDPLGKNYFGPVRNRSVIITRSDAGSSHTMEVAELAIGDSYDNEDHGIRFTVDSRSSTQATLRVENGDELVAEDLAWTMAPGQTHEGTLEASKPNGEEPSFLKEDRADQGQARVDSEGTFTYTADNDAEGSDTFTFQASAASQTDKGTAEITFNQTPQVEPLELTVAPDGSVEETLPASDAESDIEDVALTITEPPQKGTLKGPQDDGSFTYTADEGESGTDTFRYTAGDAYSESEPAEVAITIEDDDDSSDPFGGGSDSSSGSDGGSGDGSDSDSGGGGAIGGLSLVLLLGLALVGRRRRPAPYAAMA
jgi:hypothetical protein